jgi:uncharacterized membrane protein YfcA
VTFDMTPLQYVLIALAALAAGLVNALAGGGTLITFPTLSAMGVSKVVANITNTVALCPGYFGAPIAQFDDLKDQMDRARLLVPVGIVGGLAGGLLLLQTNEKVFSAIVPYLILLATALLAFQNIIRKWLVQRAANAGHTGENRLLAVIMIFIASIYGGYFGAGLGIILLATLGLVMDDSLTRLNSLKQVISFCVNVTAAILFVFSGQVKWDAAIVMAVAALIGGALGGRLAGYVSPTVLRWVVVAIGLVVSIIYLFR